MLWLHSIITLALLLIAFQWITDVSAVTTRVLKLLRQYGIHGSGQLQRQYGIHGWGKFVRVNKDLN